MTDPDDVWREHDVTGEWDGGDSWEALVRDAIVLRWDLPEHPCHALYEQMVHVMNGQPLRELGVSDGG